jgi:uncharacterized protein YjdB
MFIPAWIVPPYPGALPARHSRMRLPTPLAGAALLGAAIALTACETSSAPRIIKEGSAGDTSTTTPTTPAQPVLLTPSQANMRLGDTLRLTASGGVSGASLSWATNQPGVVVIQSTVGVTALLRAVGTGNASVSVTVVGDPARNAAAAVTVTP